MEDTVKYLIYAAYFITLALLYPRFEFYSSGYNKATGLTYRKVKSNKGYYGEYITYKKLTKYAGYGHALADVYIPKEGGIYTEVDIIYLSRKGLIVIEVKNRLGFIIGDEENRNFVQVINKERKHEMHNPIWQNRGHISAVQDVLDMRNHRLYQSLIVFGPETHTLSVETTSKNLNVIQVKELKKYLKQYKKMDDLLSQEEVNTAYDILNKYSRASKKTRKQHIARVNKYNQE